MSPSERSRYLVSLPRGNRQVFLSWRLLEDDASDLGFHVERRLPGDRWQVLSSDPITHSTRPFRIPSRPKPARGGLLHLPLPARHDRHRPVYQEGIAQ